MKIGILTYHSVYNFGANLQALSTFNYLKNLGHDPVFIDFFPIDLENDFNKSVPDNQIEAHKNFVIKHFKLTKRCRDSAQVASEIRNNKIEAIIIGSDAVVQHMPFISRIRITPSRKKILKFRLLPKKYEANFPNPFWGEFIFQVDYNLPVAFMSVSSQNTDYKYILGKLKKEIYAYAKKFVYISVRDSRTKEMFESISNNRLSPKVTPDPVFAFNQNVKNQPSKNEIIEKFNLPENYFLLSFNSSSSVNHTWVKNFRKGASKIGISCVALPMPGKLLYSNELEYRIEFPLDPLDWYCIIKYSSGYIGEKMHPIIVALHNNIPFYSFDHYGITKLGFIVQHKASKIYDILTRSNLLNARVSIRSKLNYKPPSTDKVLDTILNFEKSKSECFSNAMIINYNRMMNEILYIFKS